MEELPTTVETPGPDRWLLAVGAALRRGSWLSGGVWCEGGGGELGVVGGLAAPRPTHGVVPAAHRPRPERAEALVDVVVDGRVTAQGSPLELRERGGWFGRFIRSAEGALDIASAEPVE